MQATKTAQIYGMIISNPGITSFEITKKLNIKVGSTIHALVQRGAVRAVEGDSSRKTRYFKGSAPVILRQAAGIHQKDINAAAIETQQYRELKQQVDWLQAELNAIRSNAKFKLGA